MIKTNMTIDEKLASIVVDALPRAIFVLENRRIIFANSWVEQIFSWKPEELSGKDIEVLYRSQDEYEKIGEHVYSILEKEVSYNEIYPCKNKSGADMICSVDVSRLGEKLENKKVVVMYEDITERMEAEKGIQESEDQYRNFIENSLEIVQSMALDGRFLSVNNSWHKTFGYDKIDLEKLNIFEITAGDYKAHFQDVFRRTLAGEAVLNEEIQFETKDGRIVILEGNLIPRTFYGKVINVRCFFRDLTENRRVQREINEKVEELEVFNKLAVDRELKMIELKNKIVELEEQINGGKHKI